MAFFPISPIPQSGGNFLASMNTYLFSWCALSPTKVLIAYCQSTPLKLYVQIVNFSGNSAPTMGIPTYVADITGTADQMLLKVDAFDATSAALLWSPVTAASGAITNNICVLTVDASDNITWNPITQFSEENRTYNLGKNVKCTNPTTAITTSYNGSAINTKRFIRTLDTLGAPTSIAGPASGTNSFVKKLPTSGLSLTASSNVGAQRAINFLKADGSFVSVSGVANTVTGEAVSVVSDSLLHYFKSTTTGSVTARALSLNLVAGTGTWLTPDLNYAVPGWPGSANGQTLDAVQIDNEYFMVMGSSASMVDPSTYTPVTYSFVTGRYNSGSTNYTFAPAKFDAPTVGLPLWGFKHLHLINTNTIACFTIQGATNARVLGVRLMYI